MSFQFLCMVVTFLVTWIALNPEDFGRWLRKVRDGYVEGKGVNE